MSENASTSNFLIGATAGTFIDVVFKGEELEYALAENVVKAGATVALCAGFGTVAGGPIGTAIGLVLGMTVELLYDSIDMDTVVHNVVDGVKASINSIGKIVNDVIDGAAKLTNDFLSGLGKVFGL